MESAAEDVKAGAPAVTEAAPRVAFGDGTLETLKWLALLLMTLDHANKYVMSYEFPALFDAGRLAMPLFAFVLGANLARPDAFKAGVHWRVMRRLAVYGAIATVPYTLLGGLGWSWWPLNILFTLLVATAIIFLLERGGLVYGLAAIGLFAVGGTVVEFWWWGLAAVVTAWGYAKTGHWATLLTWVLSLAALWIINGSHWALLAIPLIFLVDRIDPPVPRSGQAFYIYYPAHLALLLAAVHILGA